MHKIALLENYGSMHRNESHSLVGLTLKKYRIALAVTATWSRVGRNSDCRSQPMAIMYPLFSTNVAMMNCAPPH